jgi:putative Mn2+ efflux pump MntP
MNIGALLLVSLSLGLSNLAAAIGIGLAGVDGQTRLRMAMAFGFFEAAMPMAGLLLGRGIANRIGDAGHYLGGGCLVLTGLYVVWQARHDTEARADPKEARRTTTPGLLLTAFALSLDNLVVGVGLSFVRIPIVLAGAVIAVVSVLMSLAGLEAGDRLGEKVGAWSEELGGVALVLVGLAVGTGMLS